MTDRSVFYHHAKNRRSEASREAAPNPGRGAFVLSDNGFQQASMPDIVRRSGLSHGAVYVYFKSKDDIIVAVAVDRHRQEAVLNSAAGKSGDPLQSLIALIRGYVRLLARANGDARRRVSINGWAEALSNNRVRSSVVEGIEAPTALVAVLVERAQREGRLSREI
jgi:AcrR family transcriptional regulator